MAISAHPAAAQVERNQAASIVMADADSPDPAIASLAPKFHTLSWTSADIAQYPKLPQFIATINEAFRATTRKHESLYESER